MYSLYYNIFYTQLSSSLPINLSFALSNHRNESPKPKTTDSGSHPAHTIIGNASDAESSHPEFYMYTQVFLRMNVHNIVPSLLIVCRYISCSEDEDEVYKDYFLHFMFISSSKLIQHRKLFHCN